MEGVAELGAASNNAKSRIVAAGAISHAAIVTILWWFMIYADHNLIPVRLWFALAWLWLAWPIAIVILWSRASKLAVGAVVAGGAIISPVISTAYSFTVWLIGGFAP